MLFFTHYWRADTLEFHMANSGLRAQGFNHTASALLRARGVVSGSRLYGISYMEGQLHVIGRMTVKAVLRTDEAVALLGTSDLWDAEDHAIARRSFYTKPLRDDAVLSTASLEDMSFICADGLERPPARNRAGEIDFQTFRNVREISTSTAESLDHALGL
jgi:hypothetical protein